MCLCEREKEAKKEQDHREKPRNRERKNEEKEKRERERVNKIIHIMGSYIHAEVEVSSFFLSLSDKLFVCQLFEIKNEEDNGSRYFH